MTGLFWSGRNSRIEPKVVRIRSAREAQSAPNPYAVFSIFYKGRLPADHQVSRTRFRNIMKDVVTPGRRRSRLPREGQLVRRQRDCDAP